METARPRAVIERSVSRFVPGIRPEGRQAAESSSGVLQIVNFEEADAALAVFLVDDGGVGTRREGGDDGRLEVVRRSELRFLDLQLRSFAPVVVRGDKSAVPIAQLEHWVRHGVGD